MIEIFRKASLCRNFENETYKQIQQKNITFPTYLSAGQEYIASSLSHYLEKHNPHIFIQHRGHSTYLAFGGKVEDLIDELLGKKTGCAHGMGGSASIQCKEKKYTSAAKTVMEKGAIKFCEENLIRLSIILPTGLYGQAIMPEHMNHSPFSWLNELIKGGEGRHKKIPNDSTSMIHLTDLANLFLAAYENPEASGRYYGVYKSLHWQDIYSECQKILPDMVMPEPLSEKLIQPTQFDFTRRDSLGVKIRDFPTLLKQTIDWIKSKPF